MGVEMKVGITKTMKTLALLAAVIVVIIPEATSLRCHACTSTKSELDCYQKSLRSEVCYQDDTYRCARASYVIHDEQRYFRGCLKAHQCLPDEYCKTMEGKRDCKTECCNEDFCNTSSNDMNSTSSSNVDADNAGNVAKTSILILIVPAILAMLV